MSLLLMNLHFWRTETENELSTVYLCLLFYSQTFLEEYVWREAKVAGELMLDVCWTYVQFQKKVDDCYKNNR